MTSDTIFFYDEPVPGQILSIEKWTLDSQSDDVEIEIVGDVTVISVNTVRRNDLRPISREEGSKKGVFISRAVVLEYDGDRYRREAYWPGAEEWE
jgi:hypothetical protein